MATSESRLQNLSSRLAVLIFPRAFAREAPGSDSKCICRDSYEFDDLSTNKKRLRQCSETNTFLKQKNACGSAAS